MTNCLPLLTALMHKELRGLLRDPQGLLVLFLMPTIFILVMSLALRDVMSAHQSTQQRLQWHDADQSYFSLELRERLGQSERLHIETIGPTDETLTPPYFGRLEIAPGLADRLHPDNREPLVRVTLDPAYPVAGSSLFLTELKGALISLRAEYITEDLFGAPEDEAALVRRATRPDAVPVTVNYPGAAERSETLPDATQQSVPAWIVFAMFFVVFPLSTSILGERREGTLQRLALLNASHQSVLAAKVPVYLGVTVLQASLMLAMGVWVVPLLGGEALQLSGRWLALLPITVATGAAALGVALLIAVLARTSAQATTIGGAVNLVLGALGGVMVPTLVMPEELQLAGLISPMSWALDGYWDIILRHTPVQSTLPECLALLALGASTYAMAAWRLRQDFS